LAKTLAEVEAEEEVVVDEEEVEEIFGLQVVLSKVLEVEIDVVVVVEIISPVEEKETTTETETMNQNGEMINMKKDFMVLQPLHELERPNANEHQDVNLKILQQKVVYRLAQEVGLQILIWVPVYK
jgi:hypothetical protein